MFKRIFDLITSLLVLILLSPVILLLCLLVFVNIGSPIFFKQERPGLKSKPFYMFKFRTMSLEVGSDGELLSDQKRLSKFGVIIRTTSLDELPAFWNVIKGEMSLVGPRPLLMEYLPLYNKNQKRRHDVKPGITGWAQVNGRNAISWEKKFDLDIWYVDHHTFWLDLKIIFLTIKKIFLKEGIVEPGKVTMSKFTGNNK